MNGEHRPVRVYLEACYDLTIDEVWPDRDGPAEPTAEDVVAAMKRTGRIERMMRDWNLAINEVHVALNDTSATWEQW